MVMHLIMNIGPIPRLRECVEHFIMNMTRPWECCKNACIHMLSYRHIHMCLFDTPIVGIM